MEYSPPDLYCASINNISLSLLYTNSLPSSITLLESSLRSYPGRFLNPPTAFNLCTMYDLERDVGGAREGKERVRNMCADWGAGVEEGSFRM